MSDSGRKVDIVAAAIEEAISTGRWPVGSKLRRRPHWSRNWESPETPCAKRYGRLHTPEFCPYVTVAACTSWRASPVEGLLGRRLARGDVSRRTEPATRTRGRSRATCSAAPHPRRSRADTCSLECPPRSRRRLHCRSRMALHLSIVEASPQFRTESTSTGESLRRDGFAVAVSVGQGFHVDEHRPLIAAIEERNPDEAARAAGAALDTVIDTVERSLA